MDSQKKLDYWKEVAIYDLATAEAMFSSGRYLYVAFMCQQSIEKLVKGIYVFHFDEEAPRTHNIWILITRLIEENKMDNQLKSYILNNKLYFADLTYYYISERYPSYKETLSSRLSKENASNLLTLTKEVFECLMSRYK
ncbi:HEPN domain-containing protein [Fusibacter bizertensis]